MSYKVKTNIFEGPFDLLVYLIENAQMSIYDIKVSQITNQYLEYLHKMEELDVEVGTEFMVLAATLIELKSKMLLPSINPDGTVEEDPRTDLTQKLLEYTRFKRRAAMVEEMIDVATHKMVRPQEDMSVFTGEPDEYLKMEMDKFIAAFKAFIYKKHKNEELEKMRGNIGRERMSVARKKSSIRSLLKKIKDRFIGFRELLDEDADRYDKVVTFVSILEMARAGVMRVRQAGNFEEIEIAGPEVQGQGLDSGTTPRMT
jgi:segregation and condensation protein A